MTGNSQLRALEHASARTAANRAGWISLTPYGPGICRATLQGRLAQLARSIARRPRRMPLLNGS